MMTYRSDVALENEIHQKLVSEPHLDESNIYLFIKEGKVVLQGTVNSSWEQCLAEFAVKSTEGVKEVIDDLYIGVTEKFKRSDADIENAAITALYWDSRVPKNTIHVNVERGCITLTGNVDDWHQQYSAENAVRKFTSVKKIVNLINVNEKFQ